MEEKDLIDKLIKIDKISRKQIDDACRLRAMNREACAGIMDEIGDSMTTYVEQLLFFAMNTIPVGTALLQKVKETATEEELRILKKHGINI